MQPPVSPGSSQSIGDLSAIAVNALLARAQGLQLAAQAGTRLRPLLGKNIGLMCESVDAEDAVFFRAAAAELGARVSHVRPSLSGRSTAHEIESTARLLGRLYDALECQGLAPTLVAQIGRDSGVPTYDGLGSKEHPTVRLAASMPSSGSAAENRRFVLQAVLLGALA
ncbi:MAG: ornithine carbamoyltransferase [Rhizobacter sp.]